MLKLEFIKNDEENYDVRAITNGNEYDWEDVGKLVKDENGMWAIEYDDLYGDESVEYEDSLEETKAELEEEFEEGKTDYMSQYFGNYKYNR